MLTQTLVDVALDNIATLDPACFKLARCAAVVQPGLCRTRTQQPASSVLQDTSQVPAASRLAPPAESVDTGTMLKRAIHVGTRRASSSRTHVGVRGFSLVVWSHLARPTVPFRRFYFVLAGDIGKYNNQTGGTTAAQACSTCPLGKFGNSSGLANCFDCTTRFRRIGSLIPHVGLQRLIRILVVKVCRSFVNPT